jgi:hypothetical protein
MKPKACACKQPKMIQPSCCQNLNLKIVADKTQAFMLEDEYPNFENTFNFEFNQKALDIIDELVKGYKNEK